MRQIFKLSMTVIGLVFVPCTPSNHVSKQRNQHNFVHCSNDVGRTYVTKDDLRVRNWLYQDGCS
jgi:hypothetical protein